MHSSLFLAKKKKDIQCILRFRLAFHFFILPYPHTRRLLHSLVFLFFYLSLSLSRDLGGKGFVYYGELGKYTHTHL